MQTLFTVLLILVFIALIMWLFTIQFKRERQAQALRERFFDDIHQIRIDISRLDVSLTNISTNLKLSQGGEQNDC